MRDVAARLIWQRYFHGLLELARSNLDKRVRRRTDEEDVAQSMFKSFCSRQQRGEFDLAGRDELWEALGDDHASEGAQRGERASAEEGDVAREQTMPTGDRSRTGEWILEEMDSAVQTPEEAMVLNEALSGAWRHWRIPSCGRSRCGDWKDTRIVKSPSDSGAPSGRSSGSSDESAACGRRSTTVFAEGAHSL